MAADVSRRLNVGQHAHLAGLKRLSQRANKVPCSPSSIPSAANNISSSSPAATLTRNGCNHNSAFSFAQLVRVAMDRLQKCNVKLSPGLSDEEFCRIEAPLAFTFPPDLKAILKEGLPVGPGFPDWRSSGLKQLRLIMNLPIAAISYEVARGRFWLKHWGPKPSDVDQALNIARSSLRKAPVLIPLYRHCYIPASPNLAGNPVFFVFQNQVSYCAFDLANFFEVQDFVSPGFNFSEISKTYGRRSLQSESFGHYENRLCNPLDLFPANGDETSDSDEFYLEWPPKHEDVKCKALEGWGRNLDAMAKRNSYDAQLRRSLELKNISGKVYMKCFDQSRITRRIEFWSDLAEKRWTSSSVLDDTLTDESCYDSDFISFPKVKKKVKLRNDSGSPTSVIDDTDIESLNISSHTPIPYWLERYFDNMTLMLRNGGWKETDIAYVFCEVSSSECELEQLHLPTDSFSMTEGLVLYINALSDALRRGGWNATDVSEAFDVDFASLQHRKHGPKIPPHIAAKMDKLAQYAALI